MTGGQIAGSIIMTIICLACGILFFSIGSWADKSEKPMHFWSGTKINPRRVRDIHGYNHENAVMWRLYSVPYFIASLISLSGFFGDAFTIAAAVILFLACFPGLLILVCHYQKIERKYIISERLDKVDPFC